MMRLGLPENVGYNLVLYHAGALMFPLSSSELAQISYVFEVSARVLSLESSVS